MFTTLYGFFVHIIYLCASRRRGNFGMCEKFEFDFIVAMTTDKRKCSISSVCNTPKSIVFLDCRNYGAEKMHGKGKGKCGVVSMKTAMSQRVALVR